MSLKHLLPLLFLALALSPATAQQQQQKQGKAKTQEGLFGVIERDGEYYFSIPESLLGRRILSTVRYTSTPAATDQYGGEMVNQQTVYWETAPNNNLVLRSDLMVTVSNERDAINRAVETSNCNPIIGTFKIEGHRQGNYLFKVSSFFSEDNAALGIGSTAKKKLGLVGYMPQASYIESIHTFPLNTEVRTVKTWTGTSTQTYAARQTGRVTLGLNISFVLLPETPMLPRLFDPRVGYFTDSYNVFEDYQQRVEKKRFITRWRLEPKDSADAERLKRGELIEPKKQIVYYIDPATPKKWRPYLIQGVNDWQKAFEQAGFKNAIVAKEWPEGVDSMSMEDARYSVIRYYASATENAYGPQVHDPRSGEILESHIGWYHNVMKLLHDWYLVQASCSDPEARNMVFSDTLMGQLIRFVSSHEVGHTLGLRHNFGSSSTVPVDSLRSRTFLEKYGHTPSIMDYARFNYVAQPEDSITRQLLFPRVNDYDCWAIKWGYTVMPNAYDSESDHWELEKMTSETLKNNRRLWFGDGETNRTNDPRCLTEDLGDDAIKASTLGIKNLKREVTQLPEWTYRSNDIYNTNLSDVYRAVCNQFSRYLHHVARNIGGVYADFKTVDQQGDVYSSVPRAKQLAALNFLDENIFQEPTWLTKLPYVKRITTDPQQYARIYAESVLTSLLSSARLEAMTSEYPMSTFLTDIQQRIFREVSSGQNVNLYRRAIQNAYVYLLLTYYKTGSAVLTQHATALAALKRLEKQLKSATGDEETKAHYAALLDQIAVAFEHSR